MELGFPVAIPDLPQNATRCFAVRLPRVPRVRLLASVVGLAGQPTLRGGWVPEKPGREPGREAGFQWLAEDLERSSPQYYVCVRTFSAQGCDALLTVLVANASSAPPPVRLRRSYPAVWPLGSGGAPGALRFVIQAEYLSAFRVTAVPVSGEADLQVFSAPASGGPEGALDEGGCRGELLDESKLVGPDIVEVPASKQKHQAWGMETRYDLCIEVRGHGIVSLTAGPRLPGPFLAPFVPAAGRFRAVAAGAQPTCEFFRLLVNDPADTTVTAIAEDGSRLSLAASLATELLEAPLANRWKGEAPPGGAGAVLAVRRADVAAAAAEAGAQGEVCLAVTVCRWPGPRGDGRREATRFWVTAVTDSGVSTLEDGVPWAASVRQGAGARAWRDFRFLVPAGAARPKEVTITATSSGKARVVADTARFPLQPGSYRWVADANASRAVLRLTTEAELATGDVHLIDCRLPCFVYASARALVEGAATGDADLQLLAVSDEGAVKLLLEGQELEQTLAAGEVQVFRYNVPRNDSSALFSLSSSEGAANFQVSATRDFHEDPALTTGHADDVVLLEPRSQVFLSALSRAKPAAAPLLFVRVRASGIAPCTFTITARVEGDAKAMLNGDEASGAVEAHGADRFRFFIGEHDVREPVEVSIDVTPLTGRPEAYVACSPNSYPSKGRHDWGRHLEGQGSIHFTSASARFRPGWVYLTLTSAGRAAFKVRVRWGNTTVALQDGAEEIGRVMAGDTRPYVLVAGDSAPQDRPVAVRLQALVGAVSLCVAELPAGGGLRPGGEACRLHAVANASGPAELGLAALDVPAEEARRAGSLLLLVRGLRAVSSFALRALASAPAVLAAERRLVVDALGPPCCVAGPPEAQLLHRRYLHFAPAGRGRASVELRALGLGSLQGATLRARRGSARGAAAGPWPVVARADDGPGAGALRRDIDLLALAGADAGRGFWLELGVEVRAPLNFTLHVASSAGATRAQSLGTRLLPNVPVLGNLTQAPTRKYEFDLGRGNATGAWHLRVQECYGHLRLGLPYARVEAHRQGSGDMDLALPAPPPREDASSLGSAILEAEASQLPVSYQVELVAPGLERGLLLPQAAGLTPSAGPGRNVSFSFSAVGVASAQRSANASLRYTLVALRGGASLPLNPNSSCGLEEALRRGLGVASAPWLEAVGAGGRGARRSLALPLAGLRAHNASLRVNVLVELLGADGRRLEARSYAAYEVGEAELSAWEGAAERGPRGGLMPVLLVLAGVGGFWGLASCLGGFCKAAPEEDAYEKDAVELEVQYDLHTDQQARLHSQRSGYVPPSV